MGRAMNTTRQLPARPRRREWLRQWGSFLTGVMIGLLIITPVLAGPLGARVVGDDDARNWAVLGAALFVMLALVLQAIGAGAYGAYRSAANSAAASPREAT